MSDDDHRRGRPVAIDFEGRQLRAHEGEPVAVALLAAGVRVLARSPKYHRPRGLFCLEGHCASCLMRIDGRPNERSCMIPVRDGLRCERQNAFPDADVDLLRAADWLFPRGMDHHRMMTGSRLANDLFLKLVRKIGGTGTLPDAPPESIPPGRQVQVDVCVVGAGPAGLAAARATAAVGLRTLVVDEQDRPGGSLLAQPGGVPIADAAAAAAREAGAELWSGATAIAWYPEDEAGGTLAVASSTGLARVRARRWLYATGGYDQGIAFPDGDRAGVLSARGCGRLVFRWGVKPQGRVLLVEEPATRWSYGQALTVGLAARGVPTVHATPVGLDGADIDWKRDLVAAVALPAPASELPRQHGARVRLDEARGGFVVDVDGTGATNIPAVSAAGDVTGWLGPDAAARDGARVGAALAAG